MHQEKIINSSGQRKRDIIKTCSPVQTRSSDDYDTKLLILETHNPPLGSRVKVAIWKPSRLVSKGALAKIAWLPWRDKRLLRRYLAVKKLLHLWRHGYVSATKKAGLTTMSAQKSSGWSMVTVEIPRDERSSLIVITCGRNLGRRRRIERHSHRTVWTDCTRHPWGKNSRHNLEAQARGRTPARTHLM